jgi:hypothetical protein
MSESTASGGGGGSCGAIELAPASSYRSWTDPRVKATAFATTSDGQTDGKKATPSLVTQASWIRSRGGRRHVRIDCIGRRRRVLRSDRARAGEFVPRIGPSSEGDRVRDYIGRSNRWQEGDSLPCHTSRRKREKGKEKICLARSRMLV